LLNIKDKVIWKTNFKKSLSPGERLGEGCFKPVIQKLLANPFRIPILPNPPSSPTHLPGRAKDESRSVNLS